MSHSSIDNSDKEAVHAHFQSIYQSETPFWTVQRLLELAQQLERVRNEGQSVEQTVVVTGIDGSTIEYIVKSPLIRSKEGDDPYPTLHVPMLHYVNVQALRLDIEENFDSENAYHNLEPETYCIGYHTSGGIVLMVPFRSLEKVETMLKDDKLEWEGTQGHRRLNHNLELAELPPINKIIGFGLGSITQIWNDERFHHRTAWQHALLLTVRKTIEDKQGNDVAVKAYVQDPSYFLADRTALANVNVEVLEDPHGFVKVDNETVVISIGPSICVKQIIADLARPAVLIWEREDKEEGIDDRTRAGFCDPYCDRVTKLIENHYDEFSFRPHKDFFGSRVTMYVRKIEN